MSRTSRRLGRKAMFEEQFNWMFVLMAGAVIIFFFFHFLVKQQNIAAQKTALTINTEIESIASGVQSADNTAIIINIPKTTLELDCTRTCQCRFGTIGSPTRKEFGDKLLFGPPRITGPKMVVWSKPWDVPYTVANFLYITSPTTKYVIGYIPGDPDSERMYQQFTRLWPDLPELDYRTVVLKQTSQTCNGDPDYFFAFKEGSSLTIPPFQPNDVYRNEEYPATRFILFIPESTNPIHRQFCFDNSFSRSDYSALVVYGSTLDEGEMIFHWKDKSGSTTLKHQDSRYAGTASLLAGVFAQDPLVYYCTMSEAFKRLDTSMEVLATRSEKLYNYWSGLGTSAGNCAALHGAVYQTMSGKTPNSPTGICTGGIQCSLPQGYLAGKLVTTSDYDSFNEGFDTWLTKSQDLKRKNFELNLNSCIEVY